jgi:dihydroorotase
MSYPIFDLHWHGRDVAGKVSQAHKETLKRSLEVAEASGVVAVAFMPNTGEPLISLDRCNEYLAAADACRTSVATFVHIGLTPDVEQVKRAVEAARKNRRIIGMKAYWGRSTGDLTIEKQEDQYRVLETLAREGYGGVLASHCEKESAMNDKLYDPKNPITWSTLCRPEKAEMESFDDIIKMAESVNFKGVIHVCHVSTSYVVDKIHNYKGPLELSCGITPHHFMFDYNKLQGPDGVQFKCNPALRSPDMRLGLEIRLLDGRIPIIESDHAPHTHADKYNPKPGTHPASGVSAGLGWPFVARQLERLGMIPENIEDVLFNNAASLYEIDPDPQLASVNLKKLAELSASYPFDPFKDYR